MLKTQQNTPLCPAANVFNTSLKTHNTLETQR